MKELTLHTTDGDPLVFLPRAKIILYKDQVLQGDHVFQGPLGEIPVLWSSICKTENIQNPQNIKIQIYGYLDWSPHSVENVKPHVFLLHFQGRMGNYTLIRYRLDPIHGFYSPGLKVAQKVARQWLFRRRVREMVQRVRPLLVFKRHAVFLPDDILWKVMQPSLCK